MDVGGFWLRVKAGLGQGGGLSGCRWFLAQGEGGFGQGFWLRVRFWLDRGSFLPRMKAGLGQVGVLAGWGWLLAQGEGRSGPE
jgi:hypothetical protein